MQMAITAEEVKEYIKHILLCVRGNRDVEDAAWNMSMVNVKK